MERAQTLVNLWTLFQIVGWAIALDSAALYFTSQNYEFALRKVTLFYLHFQRGLQRDAAVPNPPESWEQWYNS